MRPVLDKYTAVRDSVSIRLLLSVCDCRINKAVDPKYIESGTGTLTICTSSVHFLSVALELNSAFIHAKCVQ